MYTEEDLSLEMLLFKYLKHKSVGVLNVCLNLIRMKRMTNIALTLWLTPMGTISSTVLEFYSSGRKLKSQLKLELLMDQDVA